MTTLSNQQLNARVDAILTKLEGLLLGAVQQEEPQTVSGKYRVAAFVRPDGSVYTLVADTDEQAMEYSSQSDFACWLTDWEEYTLMESQE